jgi:uncharacterized protein with NRDE domain
LVLAHNRDELLARAARPPFLWPRDDDGPALIAGIDEKSGGTWHAIGPRVVAAITNDRRHGIPLPGRKTRGLLVARAARAPSARAAVADVVAHDARDFGAFNLFVADRDEAFVVDNETGAMRTVVLAPGLHVLGNFGVDASDDDVVLRCREAIAPHVAAPRAALLAALRETLARHGDGWPCVHRGPYGTVSAGTLFFGGQEDSYAVADGPSCTTAWRDETALLVELARATGADVAKSTRSPAGSIRGRS